MMEHQLQIKGKFSSRVVHEVLYQIKLGGVQALYNSVRLLREVGYGQQR